MNIFALDISPHRAAQMQCDKHVVKMTLETAQILCTALHLNDISDVPYGPTHDTHPCVLWAAISQNNFSWLCRHGIWLAFEYRFRYSKTHSSESVILKCMDYTSELPPIGRTPFVQCMPASYRHSNAVIAYRRYYVGMKSKFAKWNRGRPAPDWWVSCQTKKSTKNS